MLQDCCHAAMDLRHTLVAGISLVHVCVTVDVPLIGQQHVPLHPLNRLNE
jgi:hypothetical protein